MLTTSRGAERHDARDLTAVVSLGHSGLTRKQFQVSSGDVTKQVLEKEEKEIALIRKKADAKKQEVSWPHAACVANAKRQPRGEGGQVTYDARVRAGNDAGRGRSCVG